MEVHASSVNKKDPIQDNFRTLAPLNYLLKIVGLGCNLTSAKNQRPLCLIAKNVLRALLLALIDFYSFYYKINYFYADRSPSIKYTDIVQTVYDYTQYVVDLYFVRKYGSTMSFEYFKQYKVIDEILVIVNYCTIRMKLMKIMVFFGLFWTTTTVCDFTAWLLSDGWQESIVYSISYLFLLIKILTTLDLTSQVMHVECRMRAVGDLLQDYSDSAETSSPLFDGHGLNLKLFTNKEKVKMPSNATKRAASPYYEIQWFSRCYLLLTEQVAFINQMYGVRIILNSLSLLIDMVRFTNIAARIIWSQHIQPTKVFSGYFTVISTLMRLMTCTSVLVSLAWHCEQVYKQRLRILDIIDHLLIYKTSNGEMKTTLSELRNLVQARSMDFNMANFFRVDFSLLLSIASIVATYSIILLQSIN